MCVCVCVCVEILGGEVCVCVEILGGEVYVCVCVCVEILRGEVCVCVCGDTGRQRGERWVIFGEMKWGVVQRRNIACKN